MISNIGNFIGQKVRIILYNHNQVELDLICRKLDNEITGLFDKYKFIGHYKTQVTGLTVIELIKE